MKKNKIADLIMHVFVVAMVLIVVYSAWSIFDKAGSTASGNTNKVDYTSFYSNRGDVEIDIAFGEYLDSIEVELITMYDIEAEQVKILTGKSMSEHIGDKLSVFALKTNNGVQLNRKAQDIKLFLDGGFVNATYNVQEMNDGDMLVFAITECVATPKSIEVEMAVADNEGDVFTKKYDVGDYEVAKLSSAGVGEIFQVDDEHYGLVTATGSEVKSFTKREELDYSLKTVFYNTVDYIAFGGNTTLGVGECVLSYELSGYGDFDNKKIEIKELIEGAGSASVYNGDNALSKRRIEYTYSLNKAGLSDDSIDAYVSLLQNGYMKIGEASLKYNNVE